MFEIKIYRDSELQVGAAIALKARLWVAGWCLRPVLEHLSHTKMAKGEMAIAFIDDVPICIVVHDTYEFQAFCRKALRGKGYATRCLSLLNSKGLVSREGAKGSKSFWKKNNIEFIGYSKYDV